MHHTTAAAILVATAFLSAACDSSPQPDTDAEFRSGTKADVVDTVIEFSQELGETPEGVAVSLDGAFYVSLALRGEIRRVTPDGQQTTLAQIPLGDPAACTGPFPAILGGVAIDVFNSVYVGASSCGDVPKGIWRVKPNGAIKQIATLPDNSLANGIAVHAGRVYVSDSASTKIWRTSTLNNGGPAEVWTDEPLLADPDPFNLDPGANGLQFFAGSVFVANSDDATIVEIPFHPGGLLGGDFVAEEGFLRYGPPGSGAEHETPELPGCDDFAFDLLGRMYCTTDPFQSLLRIDPDGDVTVLLDGEDGLDGPTCATFGRGTDSTTLYISNAAFPFFPGTGFGPSLLSIPVAVPGYPFR